MTSSLNCPPEPRGEGWGVPRRGGAGPDHRGGGGGEEEEEEAEEGGEEEGEGGGSGRNYAGTQFN